MSGFSLAHKQEPLETVVKIVLLLLFALLFYTGNIWYILPGIKSLSNVPYTYIF